MSQSVKVYALVKYSTTSSARPFYTVDLDAGTLSTTTRSFTSDILVSLQFITKHDLALDINVEAWSFAAPTAHDIARKDCDHFWDNAGEHGYKGISKESNFVEGAMRYWVVVEEAEKLVKAKKTWVFQLGKKGKEKKADEGVPKEKVWFWWDVVEVGEE